MVDRFFRACGFHDLTEGIYGGDGPAGYDPAQSRQHDYLLDEARCTRGSRLLDLGCGYGTLLARARQRRAEGVGITISRAQVRYCRKCGLKVCEMDYRNVPSAWNGTFDAIIANGSIEHFVRPEDAAAGRDDAIYMALFTTARRWLKSTSAARRFVTTTVHFARPPRDPRDMLRSPRASPRGSDAFHWAVLERGWGGYYPSEGQLKRCAAGQFAQVAEVDGTEDYRRTSETWLRRMRDMLRSPRAVGVLLQTIPLALRAPRQFAALTQALFFSESWNWQFRLPNPPARLLRHTWEAL